MAIFDLKTNMALHELTFSYKLCRRHSTMDPHPWSVLVRNYHISVRKRESRNIRWDISRETMTGVISFYKLTKGNNTKADLFIQTNKHTKLLMVMMMMIIYGYLQEKHCKITGYQTITAAVVSVCRAWDEFMLAEISKLSQEVEAGCSRHPGDSTISNQLLP